MNSLKSIYKKWLVGMLALLLMNACKTDNDFNETIDARLKGRPVQKATVFVSAPEDGAAIYLNGVYTGLNTPATINVEAGTHDIGVGIESAVQYLRRSIEITDVSSSVDLTLTEQDLVAPKTWRALFIGVKQVTNGSCVTSYTTEQLDQAYNFFQWSFNDVVEPWSYNTMNWEFVRRDISDELVQLSSDNLITPSVLETYMPDINVGEYDLVVTFFRGEQAACSIAGFIGIAWYDVTALYCHSSYYTIRYYDDLEGMIQYSMENDPGVFIHEWLHTVAEMFYPGQGVRVPSFKGQVVHAAERYGYVHPWMDWYKDIIRGQVEERDGFSGIGPDAFLKCSVSESALGQCQ
ncbi:PEGA domain-containing protein [Carboxylicivirga mesophila]|uniref:PEGA domain-containing protein n=1 Tax=Carboxylicivirga mesophila TaxID=1166478 RepID=A0ABS5K6T9_9BACT|nr:PEGA domain-containing protein [Carboxylicivirga mesophila]MBS2210681.1 PEGA domain-containing protein [Carboxylicivirga mesophila]